MQGSIIGAYIVPQEGIELRQGGDGIHVQCIKPCFFQGSELALDFCLTGAIPYFCMEEYGPDGAADQGELLIRVGAAVIDIKFRRNTVGSHCVFQDFLEVVSVIVIKKPAAYQKA